MRWTLEYDETDTTPERSPTRGMWNAMLWGVLTALAFAVALHFTAGSLPYAGPGWPVASAVAFGVTWLLFRVVHRAAGMVGGLCTVLVVVLALLVMLSPCFANAMQDPAPSSLWRTPAPAVDTRVLWLPFLTHLVGVGLCAILCRNGDDGLGIVVDIVRFMPRR